MKITFKHPPTGTKNPFLDFEPSNALHYPDKDSEGIYIYGLRKKVAGQFKFIPVVVGQGKLHKRLFVDHYQGKFTRPLKSILTLAKSKKYDPKEVWDFSDFEIDLAKLKALYVEMGLYSNYKSTKGKVKFAAALRELLFFQDSVFFNLKFAPHMNTKKSDIKYEHVPTHLNNLANNNKNSFVIIKAHLEKFIKTLYSFQNQFYYVYADQRHVDCSFNLRAISVRENLETTTKEALKKVGIFTTAKANKSSIKDKVYIDLHEISKDLVNMGEHDYNNKNEQYIDPLIIRV
jgi:hypothetical protein